MGKHTDAAKTRNELTNENNQAALPRDILKSKSKSRLASASKIKGNKDAAIKAAPTV